MPTYCGECNTAVGFFARKRVPHPDGTTAVLCRRCYAVATVNHEPLGPVAPVIDALLDHPASEPASTPLVSEHTDALRANPRAVDHYRALGAHYLDAGERDKAWCVLGALAVLSAQTPEERELYQAHRPHGLVTPRGAMTEELWNLVRHPAQDRYIDAIQAVISTSVASVRACPHKSFGLRRKDRRAIASDPLPFCQIFYAAAQALNVPLPEVYFQDDQPGELLLANCIDGRGLVPAFVVRQNLLRDRPEQQVAYAAARKLAFMRPQHYVKLSLPTDTEREVALISALVLARPDYPVPDHLRTNVAGYLPELRKRIEPRRLQQLPRVVERFLQAGTELDVSTWSHAVDATSRRIGLIMCGDLETAVRMVTAEHSEREGPQTDDKINQLLQYGVSERYFTVRRRLSLGIPG